MTGGRDDSGGPGRRPQGIAARLRRRLRSERGNTVVEFVVLSVVLLIPCLYLVLTLGRVQAAVFAADVIARDVARIHATEPDAARADARSEALVALVLADHGLQADPAEVATLSCTATPCASPGGDVRAQVRIPVGIPGLGPLWGEQGPIRVGAEHLAHADEYRDVRLTGDEDPER